MHLALHTHPTPLQYASHPSASASPRCRRPGAASVAEHPCIASSATSPGLPHQRVLPARCVRPREKVDERKRAQLGPASPTSAAAASDCTCAARNTRRRCTHVPEGTSGTSSNAVSGTARAENGVVRGWKRWRCRARQCGTSHTTAAATPTGNHDTACIRVRAGGNTHAVDLREAPDHLRRLDERAPGPTPRPALLPYGGSSASAHFIVAISAG